jgi:hypothetical protein
MADDADAADRGPVDHLLDFFVFAPLGLLAESHTMVPKLAQAGRQHVGNRVQLARMVGQFAVQQGKHQASKVVGNLRAQAAETAGNPSPPGATVTAPAADVTDVIDDDDDDIATPVRSGADGDGTIDDSGIAEEDLAIPSYDSLAASQVVPRLDGLTTIELEAVRRYELAHRGRRTVLGKIALLQSQA